MVSRAARVTNKLAGVREVVAVEEAQVREALQHRTPSVRVLHAVECIRKSDGFCYTQNN